MPSQLGTHYADPGEAMITTLQKRFPAGRFHKLLLAPGEYFPRMARPSSTRPEDSPGHNPDQSAAALVSVARLDCPVRELGTQRRADEMSSMVLRLQQYQA
jgi:hypothetical protein